ncbi:MAG: CinA family protein, partial [Bacilli bacterium]|nr:CinA family protein [Bacilli bacterium]
LEKAKKVLSSLEKRGLTLGSVESLTAGLFASTICSVPGASKVFKGSFVTYATSMKTDFLNINKSFINKYGVVSKEVAREMAIIGRHGLEVDVCVSFTGNAGPTKEKGKAPVGRVNMCVATSKGYVNIEKDFKLDRNEMREECVNSMLDALEEIFEE